MAGNLGHRGLQVDFIDEGPWVLSEVLDPDVAEPVHESLEKRGVTLRLGTRVEGFIGRTAALRAVATSDGELECDAVIVCLHKLPNSALAEAAGVEHRHDRRDRGRRAHARRRGRRCGRPATSSRSRTASRCSRSAA